MNPKIWCWPVVAIAVSACAAEIPVGEVDDVEQPLQVAGSRAAAPLKRVAYVHATQSRLDPVRAAKLVAVEVDVADVAADSASALSKGSVTRLHAGTVARVEHE